jgi:DNA repair exonuclease SbcCD ATPase subunit
VSGFIEIDSARQRIVQAETSAHEAHARHRQLEDELSLRQGECENLQRSQSTLAEATRDLLRRFRDRDRALVVAEENIRALAERNARLEAAKHHAGGPLKAGRANAAALADAEDTACEDWVELARLLSDFVERKASRRRAALRAPPA